MSFHRCFLALIAFGMIAGCSDDDEVTLPPLPEGTLSGLVTNSSGNPVAGAFINFSHTVLIGDQIVSTPLSTSSLTCVPSEVTIEIFDHQGRLIRTLAIEDNCSWDGRDSAGNPVPDGPYKYRLTADGQTHESWLILASGSLSSRANTFVVRTGQDGRYSLPLADLPIWRTYPGPTEGELTGDYSFGSKLAIYAFRGDGSENHGRRLVDIGSPIIPVAVNLTIP